MRNLLSLIAVAAIVACSDAPVEPTSHTGGGHLTASLDVAADGTDSSASITSSDDSAGSHDGTGSGDGPESSAAGTDPTSLQPLACPSGSEERSVRGVIGPDGGVIGVRGHELKLPPGAVLEPTEFEIVVPVSDYVQIEVHAVGRDSHLFEVPASITISFQRCESLPASPLTAAYVDPSNRIVANMGGSVDRANKKVTFETGHLSVYAIAY